MGELTTLARPYAVAAYKRAKESGTVGEWSDALAFLAALMENREIIQAAANPKVKREQFTTAFLGLCAGHMNTEAENFVRLLIRNRRLALVKYIAELFQEYQAADEGYIDVDVTTAFPLEDEEWGKLGAVLQRVLQKQPRLRVFIDDRLIGGVYIRAGHRVIDASVRGQIERLAKNLLN